MYTVTVTKKIDGPEFGDNRGKQVTLLKKQKDGSWKIYLSYLIGAELLDQKQ